MAGSVELGPDGGGPAARGGLDELIRALGRYSAGLERIAAKLGGIEPAKPTEAPREIPEQGGQTPAKQNDAFRAISEWFRRQAPQASRIVSAFSVRPRAQERSGFAARSDRPRDAILPATGGQRPQAQPTGLLGSIQGGLANFARSVSSKLGIAPRPLASPSLPSPIVSPNAPPAQAPQAVTPATPSGGSGEIRDLLQPLLNAMQEIGQRLATRPAATFSGGEPSAQPAGASPEPDTATPVNVSPLADIMRKLLEVAQGIARKMGVSETPSPAPATPASAPEPQTTATPSEPTPPLTSQTPATTRPAPKAAASGGGMLGGAVGGIASGLGMALAAPIAFAEVVSGVAGKIAGFVSAINPGLIQTLNLAFRDLNAVVGIALQPVMQAIVPIIKQFTNALFPLAKMVGKVISEVFEALQPGIDALTDTFYVMSETLQPVIQLVGDAIKFLAPVFTFLANVVKQVYIAFGAMVAAIAGVIRGLFGAVNGGGFKDAMQGLQDGLKLLTAALIRGLGYLLKFFGSIAGLNGMIAFLKNMQKPRENAQGIAAAQNAQFSSIEQLGKSAALASVIATATPGGAAKENKTDQDFFAGMIEELEGIKENGPDLIQAVEALPGQINEYLVKLPAQIGRHVADAINSTTETVGKAAYEANPLKSAGEALGDMAAWLIYGSQK